MHNLNVQLLLIPLLVVALLGGYHVFTLLILMGMVWMNLRARAEYADAFDALRERMNAMVDTHDAMRDQMRFFIVYAFDLAAKHQMRRKDVDDATYFGKLVDIPNSKPEFVPLYMVDGEGFWRTNVLGERIDAA